MEPAAPCHHARSLTTPRPLSVHGIFEISAPQSKIVREK